MISEPLMSVPSLVEPFHRISRRTSKMVINLKEDIYSVNILIPERNLKPKSGINAL